jgi:replication factor C subunit 3/5
MMEQSKKMEKNIPWIEKYRPSHFDNIVLDPTNRPLFKNIIHYDLFPNLLFYGPPGSGKTSTIINLINEYQKKYNILNHIINKGNIIHLNASDERGIDIIRNQIHQFVSSCNLFNNGIKFVILDEVDYMTKNAQQALKYLLQNSCLNVRFCLICNYISKIDESLRNEFICIRFNQLPQGEITHFIKNILEKENIDLNESTIQKIQMIYKSDIRSMINFIQSNYNYIETNIENNIILHSGVWEQLHGDLMTKDYATILNQLNHISHQYNIDHKQIINNYFNYVIRNDEITLSKDYLDIVELIIHNNENTPTHIIIDYFIQIQHSMMKLREN